MAYNTLAISRDGGIVTLTVNRPKALNALNTETLKEMLAALNEVGQMEDARVLIVTGSGDRAFIAGADITEMNGMTVMQARAFSDLGHGVCEAIERLPVPVIAAINGFALGGGLEFAMACDLRYAATTARLGQPEVNLGIIPGFGGCQQLPRLVGKSRAKELIFTGWMIDSEKARRYGIVLDVFEADQLMTEVLKIAQEIAARGPIAIAQAKRSIDTGYNLDLHAANELERHHFASLFDTEDAAEGLSAFVDKRKPAFRGV